LRASEFHIAEDWYRRTALDDLLGVPAERVNDDRLYRALDAGGAEVANNSSTITMLTNTGEIVGGNEGGATGIANFGTIAALTNKDIIGGLRWRHDHDVDQ